MSTTLTNIISFSVAKVDLDLKSVKPFIEKILKVKTTHKRKDNYDQCSQIVLINKN